MDIGQECAYRIFTSTRTENYSRLYLACGNAGFKKWCSLIRLAKNAQYHLLKETVCQFFTSPADGIMIDIRWRTLN